MQKYNLVPLAGMAEFTPAQQLLFESWKQIVARTYQLFGFTPIETPILERAEILLAKGGGETEKQIYRFKKGDTDLAMRFDHTVPLARFVAANQSALQFPFRRMALGKVYRGEKAQTGRFREFCQADADIIGRGSLDLRYDAEVISVIDATIPKLKLGEFIINISNRKIVMGFLEALKVMDRDAVLRLLDSSEKIGEKKLKEELTLLRLDTFEIRKIIQLSRIKGDFASVYQDLARLDINSATFDQGVEELSRVARALEALGVAKNHYCFDLGIIRGLDYYTGTVFETKLTAAPGLGSICGGGRYDNLVGGFAKEKMPGVGMAIGLTRLFAQALHLGLVKPEVKTCSRVVVLPLTTAISEVLQVVGQLRRADITTEVYLQEAGVKKKMKYAGDLGVPYVLLIGDDELASGQLALKNMASGEQLTLNLASVIDYLHHH